MISDVIWHRLVRMEEHLARANRRTTYDAVDEPELIKELEWIKQAQESLELARRESKAIGLRVVREPVRDDEE